MLYQHDASWSYHSRNSIFITSIRVSCITFVEEARIECLKLIFLVTTVAVKPLTQVLTDRLSSLEKVVLLVAWLYFVTRAKAKNVIYH